MNQKFVTIPREIYLDVVSKRIIPTDILVYMYLCSKGSHGKPIYLNRLRMCKDLGGISLSKLADSLRRLIDSGHMQRSSLNGATSTELLTFVKDRHNIYIKGERLINENCSQT